MVSILPRSWRPASRSRTARWSWRRATWSASAVMIISTKNDIDVNTDDIIDNDIIDNDIIDNHINDNNNNNNNDSNDKHINVNDNTNRSASATAMRWS